MERDSTEENGVDGQQRNIPPPQNNGTNPIACQPCRKRKMRCDRALPACGTCCRSDSWASCSYDDSKKKPGVRAGYVEELERRVEKLENMFYGQSLLLQKVLKIDHLPDEEFALQVIRRAKASSPQSSVHALPASPVGSPRRREDPPGQTRPPSPNRPIVSPTVQDSEVRSLVEIYFLKVHPWLCIVHEPRFREQFLTEPITRPLHPLILSMMYISIRFSQDQNLLGPKRSRFRRAARQTIILASSNRSSLETLQALTILALDIVGSGQGPRSWSIIGMMTRVVVQLGLGQEYNPNASRQPSQHKYRILPPPVEPCIAEERRRSMWMVFFMDRISTVLTGWSPALRDEEICCRIPCKDLPWYNNEECATPLRTKSVGMQEHSNYGSFGYLVDAMACLEKAQTFLHMELDLLDPYVATMTFDRSQALDLELSRWKMSLPRHVATMRDESGSIDPMLVLVNATYNCSIILIFQVLAYHSPSLPQSIAAQERCMAAATDATNQVTLLVDEDFSLFNPYFAYYLFVTARMLLAHSVFTGKDCLHAIGLHIDALKRMATYWRLAKGFELALQDGLRSAAAGGNIGGERLQGLLDSRMNAYVAVGANEDDNNDTIPVTHKRKRGERDANSEADGMPYVSAFSVQGSTVYSGQQIVGGIPQLGPNSDMENNAQLWSLDAADATDFLGMRTDPSAAGFMEFIHPGTSGSPYDYLLEGNNFFD